MAGKLNCMFDTNIFNKLVDDDIDLGAIRSAAVVFATHVQRDEINNTRREERRRELAEMFCNVIGETEQTSSFVVGASRIGEAHIGGSRQVPTASAVWDHSRWGEAGWGTDDDLYSTIKYELDDLKAKDNNVQDALIAETSIKAGHLLVTNDRNLTAIAKRYGGKCATLDELLEMIAS